jgi:hypothetical protein
MQNQFEQIIKLFGKSPDDPISRKFVEDLGESPSYQSGCYVFPKTGFMLFCYKKKFVMACFHISRPASEGGYKGNLPSGITSSDSREDVQRKLGVAPVESKLQPVEQRAFCSVPEETEDWYIIHPLRLWFTFNPENDSLTSFTVRYDNETDSKSVEHNQLWSSHAKSN